MNWQEILIILVPLLGLMAWVYNRIEKRLEKFEANMIQEFKEIKQDTQEIRDRLTRLEGRFDERSYWEAREFRKKTGTDGS